MEKVLLQAKDLGSNSVELERWIKDWPTMYHLSSKRAQLLRGFNFGQAKKVLEVGCGCGAITRYLGETFKDVIAIEGSLVRARLARLRTRDLKNVSILNAPFQVIEFKERFDILFCIGVFEYASTFVADPDPYDFVLQYFRNTLTSDGTLILAIENQFGLKYFCSSREDHTGIMFEGLEGYPRYPNKARTFGYNELKAMLSKYFQHVDYYFPYPDYKIPSCVLSEELLVKVRAGELVGGFPSVDYTHRSKPLFDEKLALLELDRNNMLPLVSNSFLIVASMGQPSVRLSSLGVIFSTSRSEHFRAVTNFKEDAKGLFAEKRLLSGKNSVQIEELILNSCESRWVNALSLQSQIMRRVKEKGIELEDIFSPCRQWLEEFQSHAIIEGKKSLIHGRFIDFIWRNTFFVNGQCIAIDQEWEWSNPIPLNVVVIRSIYHFLLEIYPMNDVNYAFRKASWRDLIRDIARAIGIKLNREDFIEFCRLEAKICRLVYGGDERRMRLLLQLRLWNNRFFEWVRYAKRDWFTRLKRPLRCLVRLLRR